VIIYQKLKEYMTKKELLQYVMPVLLILGSLGLIAEQVHAEDTRLDALCGVDRSGCVTQITKNIGVTGGAWGGVLYTSESVEYVPITPTPSVEP